MNDTLNHPAGTVPAVISGGRWLRLAAGLALLLAMGLVYAWSVFIPPLSAEFGWDAARTGLGFTILMSMFCLGGIATGLITRKRSPRLAVQICAVLVGLGFFGASRLNSLTELYLFFSVMIGFGAGMAYNAVLSAILKWFPEKQGLVSGLLMMGFGLGSLILSTAGAAMLDAFGWRGTFLSLAVIYGALIAAGSFFIVPPGPEAVLPKPDGAGKSREAGLDMTAGQMLKRSSFWFYFAWAVMLTAAGLMVIGSAAPMAGSLGADAKTAGGLTGLIALSNGGGRVAAGFMFDRFGRRVVLPLLSCGFILTGLALLTALSFSSLTILTVGFVLTGLSYGGVPPSSSTVTSTFYGLRNYSLNFSIVNTSIVFASFLGPGLSGVMQTMSGSYNTTFVAITAFGGLSLALAFMIKKP